MYIKFKYLFCEDGKNVSLGRVSFWICFFISIYFWFYKPVSEFPPSLSEMLFATLTYNIAKRAIDTTYKEFLSKQKTTFDDEGQPKRPIISYEDK